MREFLTEITHNYYIIVAAVSWFLAQLIKTILNLVVTKELNLERMVGAGGMPSAHSAFVVSLTVIAGRLNGWNSVEFAICFAVAAVVMYDAMGVRRAAGQHAKVLNQIISSMSDNFRIVYEVEKKRKFDLFRKRHAEDPDDQKSQKAIEHNRELLKELLGHSPLEVLGGVILGIAVALMFPLP
ncbi:MAG: divergent PAP2 family protein [Negativibacillus sp.]